MKKLKIRFVAECEFTPINTAEPKSYTAQRKTLFGWKDIDMDRGFYMEKYRQPTKEALLDEIIDRVLHTCKKHVSVIEYPTIKTY